ncbi:hypothetical protein ACFWFF_06750 [Streptomyces sp. NPDC060223]|uniref:hypothetical protein n=1 Tax=unclassified Streptomyces TaxID=2593676 RepID=UPI00362B6D58
MDELGWEPLRNRHLLLERGGDTRVPSKITLLTLRSPLPAPRSPLPAAASHALTRSGPPLPHGPAHRVETDAYAHIEVHNRQLGWRPS